MFLIFFFFKFIYFLIFSILQRQDNVIRNRVIYVLILLPTPPVLITGIYDQDVRVPIF